MSHHTTAIPLSGTQNSFGLIFNKKKIKTAVEKNSSPKSPQPKTGDKGTRIENNLVQSSMGHKISSARTSPQINKIKTPLIVKIQSREKTNICATEQSLTNQTFCKKLLKTSNAVPKYQLKNSMTPIGFNRNKENLKEEENLLSDFQKKEWNKVSNETDFQKARNLSQKYCIFANAVNNSKPFSSKARKTNIQK